MNHLFMKKLIGTLAILGLGSFAVVACSNNAGTDTTTKNSANAPVDYSALQINNAAWKYDADNDVYYQLGNTYVTNPQATDYENLGIYVPGAYMEAEDNGDGTYTATIKSDAKLGDFTAETAPVVLPLNTPGYAAQKPPTEYSYDAISEYMKAGMIYVWPGIRGKDSNTSEYVGNAPWGVTDVKAAVRYLRYNDSGLAGDQNQVFVFGHSGGGAQSAIVGASGDSDLYTPYLTTLGAAMTDGDGNQLSDAVTGVMSWCPITSLDEANSAYEWNMGQFATTGTRAEGTWTKEYSNDLAEQFATYINDLNLKDENGNELILTKSAEGIYQSGTYYDAILKVVNDSLNDFLKVTEFPYTSSNQMMAGMGVGMGQSGAAAQGGASNSSNPAAPTGAMPSGEMPSGGPNGGPSGSEEESTTYATVHDYIAYLNQDTTWVEYDESTNTAKVLNLAGFVQSQKEASKDVGALDGVDRGQTENTVFGIGGDDPLHFSQPAADVIKANEQDYAALSNWNEDYAASGYEKDFTTTDEQGVDVQTRQNMYNPMYYLSGYYDGSGTSKVAENWRIRTGIKQGDTATTVEYNLALALQSLGINTDFATIWGQGHTMAELEGNSTTNFINWIKSVS